MAMSPLLVRLSSALAPAMLLGNGPWA